MFMLSIITFFKQLANTFPLPLKYPVLEEGIVLLRQEPFFLRQKLFFWEEIVLFGKSYLLPHVNACIHCNLLFLTHSQGNHDLLQLLEECYDVVYDVSIFSCTIYNEPMLCIMFLCCLCEEIFNY